MLSRPTKHRGEGPPTSQRPQGGPGAWAGTKGQTREAKLAPTLQNTCPWCIRLQGLLLTVSSPNSFRISRSMAIWGSSLLVQMVKESAYNTGDLGSIPELGRSPGEGDGCPLQYSCLENPMDRGA